MENQTRFDLNAAIENWRQELAAQPNLAPDDRRELETHVRDAIAGFQQRGLNDEESFWLARRRVGPPQQIGEEFVKADPAKIWRERGFWMVFALFLSGILSSLIGFMAFNLVTIRTPLDGSILHFFQTTQLVSREVSAVSPILFPLIIALLMRSERMVRQFSKLTRLIDNRLHLTIGIFAIIALSAAFQAIAAMMNNARVNSLGLGLARFHFTVPVGQIVVSTSFHSFLLALVLFLLLPTQNRKTPKRA